MGEEPRQARLQFSLADVLLAMVAVGLWTTFFLALRDSHVPAPIVAVSLLGITGALHVLFRGRKHAWPIAAILAPLVAGVCLAAAAIVLQS